MSETKLTTEDNIREAALKIFKQKGFDGSSVQDIATEAGTTKSMVNYYFRTKEKLFSEIFHNQFRNLFEGIGAFILSDASLKEKIERIVALDIDKLCEIPDLPIFVLTEIHHNPEIIFKRLESVFFCSCFVVFLTVWTSGGYANNHRCPSGIMRS